MSHENQTSRRFHVCERTDAAASGISFAMATRWVIILQNSSQKVQCTQPSLIWPPPNNRQSLGPVVMVIWLSADATYVPFNDVPCLFCVIPSYGRFRLTGDLRSWGAWVSSVQLLRNSKILQWRVTRLPHNASMSDWKFFCNLQEWGCISPEVYDIARDCRASKGLSATFPQRALSDDSARKKK